MEPKISIITVVYNAEHLIGRTLKSIREQTYVNIETVVVDGKSDDGTVNVARRFNVDKLVSEPDKSIYDAMNKGLMLATGDYVWFINAGDEIYEKNTVEKIFKASQNGDVYYGEAMIVNEGGVELGLRRLKPPLHLSWKSFQMGQLVSHQAFIARRRLSPEYDLSFQYSADTDWQIKVLKKAKSIINTQMILCRFLAGGKSRKTILPSLRERWTIMCRYYGFARTLFNHILISVKFMWFLIRHGRF